MWPLPKKNRTRPLTFPPVTSVSTSLSWTLATPPRPMGRSCTMDAASLPKRRHGHSPDLPVDGSRCHGGDAEEREAVAPCSVKFGSGALDAVLGMDSMEAMRKSGRPWCHAALGSDAMDVALSELRSLGFVEKGATQFLSRS
jgi:hypothetical protein